MGGRRKNPHPKRARNVKTVLKGDEKEERGRGEEKEGDEELRLLRMLQNCGSCEDDENVALEQNHHHVPKAFIIPAAKGVKRKRGQHECLDIHPSWLHTCVFTRTRNRMNVMFARSVLLDLVV